MARRGEEADRRRRCSQHRGGRRGRAHISSSSLSAADRPAQGVDGAWVRPVRRWPPAGAALPRAPAAAMFVYSLVSLFVSSRVPPEPSPSRRSLSLIPDGPLRTASVPNHARNSWQPLSASRSGIPTRTCARACYGRHHQPPRPLRPMCPHPRLRVCPPPPPTSGLPPHQHPPSRCCLASRADAFESVGAPRP